MDFLLVLFGSSGGLPDAVRGLQISQCRRVCPGRCRTDGSQTGSAEQRREALGRLQPSGDGHESNRSYGCRRSVGAARATQPDSGGKLQQPTFEDVLVSFVISDALVVFPLSLSQDQCQELTSEYI